MTDRYTDGSYLEKNPGWHDSHAAWKASQILAVLRAANAKPRTIGDIGCGTGGVLKALAPELPGVALTGYEISPQAVELAHADVEVKLGDFRDDDRRFDLAMAIDVFEHVPDYHGFLNDLHAKAPMAMFHIPLDLSVYTVLRDKRTLLTHRERIGHLHYFTENTALATLRDTGWEPMERKLTNGIFQHDQLSLKRKLRWAPVAALARINESAAAKVASGYGLMVLSRGR